MSPELSHGQLAAHSDTLRLPRSPSGPPRCRAAGRVPSPPSWQRRACSRPGPGPSPVPSSSAKGWGGTCSSSGSPCTTGCGRRRCWPCRSRSSSPAEGMGTVGDLSAHPGLARRPGGHPAPGPAASRLVARPPSTALRRGAVLGRQTGTDRPGRRRRDLPRRAGGGGARPLGAPRSVEPRASPRPLMPVIESP